MTDFTKLPYTIIWVEKNALSSIN